MRDTTFRRPIKWNSSALTDVGLVREANEDAVFAKPEVGLWAVADGMGGHEVGDVASGKIVEALDNAQNHERLSDFVDAVEEALLNVNKHMLELSRQMFDGGTMGSTAVVLIIRGTVGFCLWAGDSRLYRFRNNFLQQLSRDHSQVEEMVQMGLIQREEAVNHPQTNVITRAIGVEHQLYVDINVFDTRIGDTFLLCSDGLYNAVNNENIISALAIRDAQQSAELLIQYALEGGARDNVSVVVVKGEPGQVSRQDIEALESENRHGE